MPITSYRELRIRNCRDRCRRHFSACLARASAAPGRSGVSTSSRLESRPPGATLSRTPDGRGRGGGAGSKHPCYTPPEGRPRSKRTRKGQHVLTDVFYSQSKKRTSSFGWREFASSSVTSQVTLSGSSQGLVALLAARRLRVTRKGLLQRGFLSKRKREPGFVLLPVTTEWND